MNRIIVTGIILSLITIPAYSAVVKASKIKQNVQTTAPTKYEIGQYSFNLMKEAIIETPATVKKTEQTVLEETNKNLKEIKDIEFAKQKEIINQVKTEEIEIENKVKEINNKTQETIKNGLNKIDKNADEIKLQTKEQVKENFNKVDNELKGIEKNLQESKKEIRNKTDKIKNKAEKEIKYDKDRPPVQFKIVPLQYDGEMTKTIEKL
ncbi:hypothetical protein IJG14_06350 [bacterium]|nr:hypothetical protein [bacterium]